MVLVKKELLSPCGLYCGVCRVYVAHRDDDKEFKQELLPIYKAYGTKTVEDTNVEFPIIKFLSACTPTKGDWSSIRSLTQFL